jgi:hypothetical protein
MCTKIEIADVVCDNITGECREVVKITRCGVHLSNGNNRKFMRHKALQEGIQAFRYGIIPNE